MNPISPHPSDTATALTLQTLNSQSAAWAEAVSLYETAFPANERRPTEAWTRLADAEDTPFQLLAIHVDAQFAGFISSWNFGEFTYVEHFAICPKLRGGGIGARVLDTFCRNRANRLVVLEVEPPQTAMARRRINFYNRCGFVVDASPYMQPPYRAGDPPIPLKMMTTQPDVWAMHRAIYTAELHRTVYHFPHEV